MGDASETSPPPVRKQRFAVLRFTVQQIKSGDQATLWEVFWAAVLIALLFLFFREAPIATPPFEQLYVAEGPLRFSTTAGTRSGGSKLLIDMGGQSISCDKGWGGPGGCGVGTKMIKRLWEDDGRLGFSIDDINAMYNSRKKFVHMMEGRPAKVWWYEQPTVFGTRYLMVAQLEVQGVRVIDYQEELRSRQDAQPGDEAFSAIYRGFCLLLLVFVWYSKRHMAYQKLYP